MPAQQVVAHRQPAAVGLVLCALVLLLSILGWTFGWYGTVVFFDELSHVIVPLGVAALVTVLLDTRLHFVANRHRVLGALFGTCVTVAIAVLWEIAEWVYDRMVSGNPILGKYDTITDLSLGILGACIGSVIGILLLGAWTNRRVGAG